MVSSKIKLFFTCLVFLLLFTESSLAIEPTTVALVNTYPNAYHNLGYPSARASFYDGSKFWVFFSNYTGGGISWSGQSLYSYSIDGISWSQPAILKESSTTHYYMSVWFENFTTNKTVYVSMSQFTTAADLRFRRGNITGTTIEWEPEVSIPVTNYVRGTFVTLNSSNYPWIGFCMYDGSKYRPWVVSANDIAGSAWSSPVLISDEDCMYPEGPTLLPLSNGKMYMIWYNSSGQSYRGAFFNGTLWKDLTTIDSATLPPSETGQYAVNVNDVIFLAFTGSDGVLYLRNWTEAQGWGERIVIDRNTDNSPQVTIGSDENGDLHVFWNRTNIIYYKKYSSATGWSLTSTPFGTSFSDPRRLRSAQAATNSVISLVWLENTSTAPFPVRHAYIDELLPQWSLNSTNATLAGTAIEHRLKWDDNVGLSYAIFSFDNCTGSFQNITGMSLSGNSAWSNFTVVINSTVGCQIRWCVYANDTSGNWNGTSCENPFTYTTSSLSSTLKLNTTKVWWNDSILASGYMTRNGQPANGTLNLFINNQVYCSNVEIINGNWDCTFYAPLEIKTYTVSINYTDDLGNPGSNTTTLTVSPFYGKAPTRGFVSILEQYVMVQDLNGKIKRVKLSLAVWR